MTVAVSAVRLKTERLIGTGLTSEVYSWGEERVLKLFLPWVSAEKTEHEFRITAAIHNAGVSAPSVFELVEFEKRAGIVFELVRGQSLLRWVERRPWRLFGAARHLADLHASLHDHTAPAELPSQHEQIGNWIDQAADLSERQKQEARQHLSTLPGGDSLCHGDFHPGNILLTAQGPVVIDWSGATRGDPLGDVARTSVLFESASLPPTTPFHIHLLMKISRRMLHSAYLKRYLQLRSVSLGEIERWRVAQRIAGAAWRAQQKAAMA